MSNHQKLGLWICLAVFTYLFSEMAYNEGFIIALGKWILTIVISLIFYFGILNLMNR